MAPRDPETSAKLNNRQILIEATLTCISEIGLLRTSVSEIIDRAGLSRGMIHLHFGGKDNLLVAAAQHTSNAYFERLERHLEGAKPDPQFRIDAMIRGDLSEEGLTESIVRISHEFQAATRALPMLAPYSDTRDARLRGYFEEAFLQICDSIEAEDPRLAAQDMTSATVALMEGLWVDFLMHPQDFDRARAARVVFRTLSGLLPDHFSMEGAKDAD